MRSLLHLGMALVLAVFAAAGPAGAQPSGPKRVALVVGNSAYKHTPALANPRNDAGDMAAVLKTLGFEVVDGYDLDKAAFERRVRIFAAALENADAGVFFYAGHALQVDGQNYLAPIDAELTASAALDFEMVRLDLIQRTMERQARTNILFLDACRDNPLARNLARSMGTRSAAIANGLASVEAGAGTLISFSTQPGNVALDGGGRNSPFAGALVRNMRASNDDLGALLISVRRDVMTATANKQVPWEHSSMTGRFYFNPAAASPQASQPATSPPPQAFVRDEAAEVWSAIKDSTSPAVLQAFIERFSNSFYVVLARERLQAVESSRSAAAAPAPSSPSSAAPPPAPAAAESSTPPASAQPWTLAGGKSLDLFDGRVLFSMIGTPYQARRERVGVRVNGEETGLSIGDFVHLSRPREKCGIFLREINLRTHEADFQVLCGRAFGNPPQERARLALELLPVAPNIEVVTLDRGSGRQFEAGRDSVLISFFAAPYQARRERVGVRIHGEDKGLMIGQRIAVRVGDRNCAFVLREIHAGFKTAEFQWQC